MLISVAFDGTLRVTSLLLSWRARGSVQDRVQYVLHNLAMMKHLINYATTPLSGSQAPQGWKRGGLSSLRRRRRRRTLCRCIGIVAKTNRAWRHKCAVLSNRMCDPDQGQTL